MKVLLIAIAVVMLCYISYKAGKQQHEDFFYVYVGEDEQGIYEVASYDLPVKMDVDEPWRHHTHRDLLCVGAYSIAYGLKIKGYFNADGWKGYIQMESMEYLKQQLKEENK